MIEAVIFDMDGVLIDSEPLWKIAEKRVFAEVGINMTTEMCNFTMGYRTNEVVDYWYERNPWTGKSKQQVDDDLVNYVIEEIKAEGKMMNGVSEALTLIKNNNYKIALASSSAMRIIDIVIDKLEIRKYFDVVQSAEKEEYGKPHPAVFLSAAKKLNVNPAHCIVIEDSVNGVIAAKAAKMKAIAIPDIGLSGDKRFAIADLQLNDLTEFNKNIIDKLGK